MDRSYIDQHNVIERFVLDQLTEEELDGFLVYQMMHPPIRKEVREMRQIVLAIRSTSPSRRRSPRWKISLAVILFFFLLGGLVIWSQTENKQVPDPIDQETEVIPSPEVPPKDSQAVEPAPMVKPENPSPPVAQDIPAPDNASEEKTTSPPVKDDAAEALYAANFVPNKYLEANLDVKYRGNELQIKLTEPAPEAHFELKDKTTNLHWSGTLENVEEPSIQKVRLLLFSNHEEDYLDYRPLFQEDLQFGDSMQFTLQKNLELAPGLYYFIMEDPDSGKVYHTGKFTINIKD